MRKPTLELDGMQFEDLDGFYSEISRELLGGRTWGRNLDALDDVLRGGFGTPDGGFRLRWRHADRSREVLGHGETARWLEGVLQSCHPSNVDDVKVRLEAARRGEGPTLFDQITEIIRDHGLGGSQEKDGIQLELE